MKKRIAIAPGTAPAAREVRTGVQDLRSQTMLRLDIGRQRFLCSKS